MAEISGEDRLVPPIPNHPGTGWSGVKVPQTLNGVFALPVQNSAYGVNSSASAEMSGTSRHGLFGVASWQFVEVPELMTPGPFWYEGMPQ